MYIIIIVVVVVVVVVVIVARHHRLRPSPGRLVDARGLGTVHAARAARSEASDARPYPTAPRDC